MNEEASLEFPPRPWSTRYILLLLSAFAQLISLVITWPLWNVREEVPHLPVFELGIPQISFGWILVVTLAVIPFRPKLGVWLHFAVMLVSCLFDQMRTQPQFLATWILMLAMLGNSWKNYTRWFLSSLWIWAGLHKFISPEWHANRAFNVSFEMGLDPVWWFTIVAIGVAAGEMAVGLLAWWKPRWGAFGCVLLHVGIVIYLSPLFMDWNYSVLPWNIATAIVGFWILWTCDVRSTVPQRIAFGVFMIVPAGFFIGCLDHGYSHVLYSGSIAEGLITRADGSIEPIEGWGELAIPFPNERRTLKQRFGADSQEGDRLHIFDPRWALDDLHFIKRDGKVELIDRSEFFTPSPDWVVGVELDSKRHLFLLSMAGARMLKRDVDEMIYAIEFKPEYFKAEQLSYLKFLPNIEEIQLSGTSVTDDDLKWLVELPRLSAVGLQETAITERGLQILFESDSLQTIQFDNEDASGQALQDVHEPR